METPARNMKSACGKRVGVAIAAVGLALAAVFVSWCAIDLKRDNARFESPPGLGYSGISVDIRDGTKQDANVIVERLMGLEGTVSKVPSMIYSIGDDRTRIRANRKSEDLGSSKFDDFREWFREQKIAGSWSVVFFENDRASRSFRSGYEVDPRP